MKRIKELLVDLYGCDANLDDVELLTRALKAAAQKMGSQIVKTIRHKFSPSGTSVILILAETHISIHTWPEHHYAALDIFICNEDIDPQIGWKTIEAILNPSRFRIHKLTRKVN